MRWGGTILPGMSILLVCTGNTCRSPMAAALLREAIRLGPVLRSVGIEVSPAGTGAVAGAPATTLAMDTMKRRGIALDGHRARQVSTELVGSVDLVLTMAASHKAAILGTYRGVPQDVFTLAKYSGTKRDVVDPLPIGTAEAYEACAVQLAGMIPILLERLRRQTNRCAENA